MLRVLSPTKILCSSLIFVATQVRACVAKQVARFCCQFYQSFKLLTFWVGKEKWSKITPRRLGNFDWSVIFFLVPNIVPCELYSRATDKANMTVKRYISLRTADVSPRSSPLRNVSRGGNVPQRRWARRNVCRSQASAIERRSSYVTLPW